MKTKFWILMVMMISIIFSTAITLAEFFPDEKEIQLLEGENEILIPEQVSPFYVGDLIKSYPEILMVTYFEFEEEKGYVNAFGGIGEDFIIYPNQKYNITIGKNMGVKLR